MVMSTMTVLVVTIGGPDVASARTQPGRAPTTNGLVLHYSFDNDTGTTARDSSPTALAGRYRNTTAAAARAQSVPGKGRAIALTGVDQQWIAVPERNALDVDRYTLAAYVRYTGVENDQTFGRWEVLEKADAYWLNIRTDGKVRVGGFFGGCTSAAWRYLDSSVAVPIGTWTHVASTYDGTTLTVWINGRAAGSRAVSGRTCSNDQPLAIGAKNQPAKGLLEAFWDGRLDDVRIYRRALSASEIAGLMA